MRKHVTTIVLALVGSLLLAFGLGVGCGDNKGNTAGTWYVVMPGSTVLSIQFSRAIAPGSSLNVGVGASTVYSTGGYNFYITTGSSTGGCQPQFPQVVVGSGQVSGSIVLTSPCSVANGHTSLFITLGNSVANIMDINGNFIVKAGSSATAVISPPGSGAVSNTVSY